jgi:hypothetical protein
MTDMESIMIGTFSIMGSALSKQAHNLRLNRISLVYVLVNLDHKKHATQLCASVRSFLAATADCLVAHQVVEARIKLNR